MTPPTRSRIRLAARGLLLAIPILAAIAAGCSSAASTATDRTSPPATAPEDLVMQATDFVSLRDMTAVRGFFVANRLGHLDEALAVANDPGGGTYPVGTVIQLVPQEAMVKRAPGFDAASDDWEFFSLDVSPAGTTILTRGGAEVVNRFGGSCSSCHSAADPKFDFICEHDHGCDPLPIGDDVIRNIQQADPRPA
ncbi:MAG: hypothetical protein ACXWCM_01515 [Acidimicrobiales bacterium]